MFLADFQCFGILTTQVVYHVTKVIIITLLNKNVSNVQEELCLIYHDMYA